MLFFYDIYFRLNSNDFFWVNYYFFWTTFTYLPAFFFSLSTLLISVKIFKSHTFYVLLLVVALAIYTYETTDLLLGVLNTSPIGSFFTQLNTFLLNSLNKYHPFLLYWGLISTTLVVLVRTYWIFFGSPWSYNQVYALKKTLIIRRLYILLIALALGSWWAFQEGTWGGWWNWDPSEVFGLLFFTTQLVHLHEFFSYRKFLKVTKKTFQSLLLLGSLYFFIQLNFEIISHNFGVKFFFFFNNNLFLITSLIFLWLFSIWSYLQDMSFSREASTLLLTPYPNTLASGIILFIGSLVSFILLASPLILSFIPTFQYFTFTYFGLNLFNFELYSGPTTLGLVLIWIFFFLRLRFRFIATLIPNSLLLGIPSTIFTFITQTPFRFITQLHLFLGIFLTLTLLLPITSLAYPLFFGNFRSLLITETLLASELELSTLNADLIEAVMSFRGSKNSISMTSWQLIHGSNSLTLNAYLLPLSNLNLSNYYLLQPQTPLLVYLTETHYTQSLLLPLALSSLLPYLRLYTLPTKE